MTGPQREITMTGSSIAAPDAAPWVIDFLNAAYYRRADRELEDLRLAWAILTTRWHQLGRRLHARDLPAFVAAYRRAWGTLSREALLAGAARLIGGWFPEAWADRERRGWGIVFEDGVAGFDPSERLRDAALGELTPPVSDARVWHTYPPVGCDPDVMLERLRDARSWPDRGTALGRFTALRPGPTAVGQTFEIDVMATVVPGVPVASRGYVTVTRMLGPGTVLDAAVDELGERVGEPVCAGRPRALIALTTHAGHFLGRAISHLVLDAGQVRDVGCWDPLTPYLQATYAIAGREAQQRFWGPDDQHGSMLLAFARG